MHGSLYTYIYRFWAFRQAELRLHILKPAPLGSLGGGLLRVSGHLWRVFGSRWELWGSLRGSWEVSRGTLRSFGQSWAALGGLEAGRSLGVPWGALGSLVCICIYIYICAYTFVNRTAHLDVKNP